MHSSKKKEAVAGYEMAAEEGVRDAAWVARQLVRSQRDREGLAHGKKGGSNEANI